MMLNNEELKVSFVLEEIERVEAELQGYLDLYESFNEEKGSTFYNEGAISGVKEGIFRLTILRIRLGLPKKGDSHE